MDETMTTSQVKNRIANIEKKIGQNNEALVNSKMYLTTTPLSNEKESNGGPKNAHTPPSFIKKLISSGTTSIDAFTVETASSVTYQAEAVSDQYSDSAEQYGYGIDYGYDVEVEPPKKTMKGSGKANRRSSCGSGMPVCTRIPRRSSINGGCRRRNSLDVCQRIDEDNDCIRFTVTHDRDNIHDDDGSVVSTSFAPFSFNRRGSFVSRNSASQGGDDDDKSVTSAISRTSKRVRELPRDVEFDSSDSSSSSESDSADVFEGQRCTAVTATLRW